MYRCHHISLNYALTLWTKVEGRTQYYKYAATSLINELRVMYKNDEDEKVKQLMKN